VVARPKRSQAEHDLNSRMTPSVIFFDLDDTLVIEWESALSAFTAAGEMAAARYPVSPETIVGAARNSAREAWYDLPTIDYCLRVGISSWEGLWCKFEGDEPSVVKLRELAPSYRADVWQKALAASDIFDEALALEMAAMFQTARRARHLVYDDVRPALEKLKRSYRLGIITNGAICLQHEKLAESGLAPFFDVVTVSSELGVGKPDHQIFMRALMQASVEPSAALMIGDSIDRDVEGAREAGVAAIWLNRDGRKGQTQATTISSLGEVAHVLSAGAIGSGTQ
jgi:putative hydrolase of the HAD superfamily